MRNVADSLGEPDGTVRPGRDEGGSALGCWQRELADRARRRDAPDLAALEFGKPEVAIWPGRDAQQVAACWNWELADVASRGDAPDLAGERAALEIGASVGEPEGTVAARRGVVSADLVCERGLRAVT